jgi:S-(hydroxymethyl)glutathione dehydrogenase/alcohol dehydrogenase
VFGFIPSCGKCPKCSTGHQNLCDLGAYLLAGRQVTDFTSRHHAKGQDLGLMCCIGTFGEYTVASEASCIKIDNDIPLDKAALVGCGVTTGWGSAVYAADVQAGETVVVIGCGGVGMNAVQGASMSGARHVIAVDPLEFKREQAQVFGATHSAASMEEAVALVGDLTWGAMADKAIITVGVAEGSYVQQALNLVGKGGRVVQTAVAPFTVDSVSMNLFELTMYEKQLVGSIFGSANPRRDIPRLLRLYQEGQLMLDELVTNTYPLEDINVGYQAMRDGTNIRGMVIYDHGGHSH